MTNKIIMFLVLASLVIDWDRTMRNFGFKQKGEKRMTL